MSSTQIQLIVNDKQSPIVVDRFNSKSYITIGDMITLSSSTDYIELANKYPATWEEAYNNHLSEYEQDVVVILEDLKNTYIWSINNVFSNNGAFYIIPGNCLAVHMNTISKTISLKKLCTNINYISSTLVTELSKYTMCIYHYLNYITHELLNVNPPYGLYQRYLSAQARWNVYVFSKSLNIDVVGSIDGIFITLGYNNYTCEDTHIKFTVDISVKHHASFLSLFGIFLDEACASTQAGDYKIYRDFITSQGTVYGLQNITDPNYCIYEYHVMALPQSALARWTTGKITIESNVAAQDSVCNIFSIRKNSAVVGYTKRSGTHTFEITVTMHKNNANVCTKHYVVSCSALAPGEDPRLVTAGEG